MPHVNQLFATQKELQQGVRPGVLESRSRLRKAAGSGKLPNFDVGDFVLVARVRHPGVTPELAATWTGPFGIVGIEISHLYQAQNITVSGTLTVHVPRLQLYSNSQLDVTADLKDVQKHAWAQGQCAIASIVSITKAEMAL